MWTTLSREHPSVALQNWQSIVPRKAIGLALPPFPKLIDVLKNVMLILEHVPKLLSPRFKVKRRWIQWLVQMESSTTVFYLRERGKRERLRRIKEAAFAIFREQGFDRATTREIALRADVSIGTLFVYARDKRDLLCLVLNEDLDAILEASVAAVPASGMVNKRVVALLKPIYAYFAREPELARAINREVARFDRRDAEAGEQARRFYARMDRWHSAVTEIIASAKADGLIRMEDDVELLGRALFDAHLAEVRRWMDSDAPDAKTGIKNVKKMILVILGDREVVEDAPVSKKGTPKTGQRRKGGNR